MIIVISVSMMKLTAMMLGDDDCPLLLDYYDEDDADVDDGADADADADADAAYGTDDFGQFFKAYDGDDDHDDDDVHQCLNNADDDDDAG